MFFFFFFPNYFQYLDFKNWNKKLFQVMQLQRKIYWDQLKMCYFCECVKPQKKKKKGSWAMLQWRQPCSEQWLTCGSPAGPNEEGISPDGRRGRKKAAQGKKGLGMNGCAFLLFCSCSEQWQAAQFGERDSHSTWLLSNPAPPEVTVDWSASICKLCLDIILAVGTVICFMHFTH